MDPFTTRRMARWAHTRLRGLAALVSSLALTLALLAALMGPAAPPATAAGPSQDRRLVDNDLGRPWPANASSALLDRPPPVNDCNRNRIEDGLELWGMLARGPVPVRAGPVTVLASDFDGDRRADLLVVNQAAGNVSLAWQRSGRRFVTAPVLGVGSLPSCAAAADLDGDGDKDIVLGHAGVDSVVTVLWNDGRGAFRREDLAVSGDPAEPAEPRCVALADIDGDGDVDILATTGTHRDLTRLVLLANAGGGRFAAPVARMLAGLGRPTRLVVADLDGDGRPDIAIGDANVNAHDAILTVANGGPDRPFAEWPVSMHQNAGSPVTDLIAADLDGDGDIDLALVNPGHLAVLINDGARAGLAGRFGSVDRYLTDEGGSALAVVDLQGDGRPDLVVADTARDRLRVLSNIGAGAFVAGGSLPVGVGPVALWAGQLDDDRGPEVVVAHRGSRDAWVLHGAAVEVQRDCNGNQRPDACDIRAGRSADSDRDGVPDECRRPQPAPARRAP